MIGRLTGADIYHGGLASERKVGGGVEESSLTGGDKKDCDAEEGIHEEVRRCMYQTVFPNSSPPWKKNEKRGSCWSNGAEGGLRPRTEMGVTGFGISSKRDAVLGHLVLPNGRLHVGVSTMDNWVKITQTSITYKSYCPAGRS